MELDRKSVHLTPGEKRNGGSLADNPLVYITLPAHGVAPLPFLAYLSAPVPARPMATQPRNDNGPRFFHIPWTDKTKRTTLT